MTIDGLLPRHARYRPDHPALVVGERRFTYREFNAVVNKLANGLLASGLTKGDKVATVLPNCLELMAAYWAAAKTGIVIVPSSTLLQEIGLATLLRDSDTALVLAHAPFAETLGSIRGELPAIREDRYILVEGIVHTHYVRAMYCSLFASAWRMTPESVVLHAGAIVFNGAMLDLMPWMYLGCTYILHESFNAQAVIRDIEKEKVTHIVMVNALTNPANPRRRRQHGPRPRSRRAAGDRGRSEPCLLAAIEPQTGHPGTENRTPLRLAGYRAGGRSSDIA